MDWVVVTRAADMHLLRYLLASAECFFQSGGKLVLFTSRRDQRLLAQMALPAGTRLVFREEFPELGDDDYCNQLYLKLRAYEFVDSEHFLVLDSDFLFVAPCQPDDFFHEGKPVWFHAPWDEQALRFRAASEAFVGASIDRFYMRLPQWIYTRSVARCLAQRYDLRGVLRNRSISEHLVYAWFAHRFFADSYRWVDVESADVGPVVGLVNQRPPSYCVLDPEVQLDDFPGARILALWSHWDLAEAKMREFLRAAHSRWTDRPMVLPDATPIFVPIDPLVPLDRLYAEIRGLHSDGWVKEEVRFSIVDARRGFHLCLELHIPHGPVGVSFQIGSQPPGKLPMESGIGRLEAEVEPGTDYCPVSFRVDGTAGVEDSQGRQLVARLVGLWVTPSPSPAVAVAESPALRDKNREIARLAAQLSARTALLNKQYRRAELLEKAAEERLTAILVLDSAAKERLEAIQRRDREISRLTAQLSAARAGSLREKA